jgi:hypothetical protein
MKDNFLERIMHVQEHKNVGRSSQRSETVSGDETKGLSAMSTQKRIQPEAGNDGSGRASFEHVHESSARLQVERPRQQGA